MLKKPIDVIFSIPGKSQVISAKHYLILLKDDAAIIDEKQKALLSFGEGGEILVGPALVGSPDLDLLIWTAQKQKIIHIYLDKLLLVCVLLEQVPQETRRAYDPKIINVLKLQV